jgi:MFS family permease
VSEATNLDAPQKLTLTHWLIIFIAIIGFAFDTYELLMLPLILPSAMRELLPSATPGSHAFNLWRGLLFFIPAVAGGIFGLLGGYLTDRLGRRRVLTGSILLYAVSAFASGYSTSIGMLLFFRCTTFVGVCVEFVAAVAWLAELFPNFHQRERVLGYTQAFSSFGGLMVSGANLLILGWVAKEFLPPITMPRWLAGVLGDITSPNPTWRYTLMSGLIPAIPLILIRPFLPESPAWQQKKLAGTLRRPSLSELFAPALKRTTIVTTIMVAMSFGAAFGAIQQMPQILPMVPDYLEKAKDLPPPEQKKVDEKLRGQLSMIQEIGGLTGRFALAMLAALIISRRGLLRVFQIPGLIIVPLVFAYWSLNSRPLFDLNLTWMNLGHVPISLFGVGMFLAGFFTVAQFSFWGNYLPRVYPLHLRGTGESFAANIGGRMIGTSFALVASLLAGSRFIPGDNDAVKMAYVTGGIALFVYLAGSIACFFLPEPKEGVSLD